MPGRTLGRKPVVFSVPSGNYGDLMGGIFAKEMGLPVKKFVISTNANNEVPEFLKTGIYKIIAPSLNCLSSAMNVGHPSNLARIIALYGGIMDESGNMIRQPDIVRMRNDFFAISVSDETTRETIASAYKKNRILLEPHGAVAWRGLENYMAGETSAGEDNINYVALETAHPAKFPDEIFRILNLLPPSPPSLERIMNLEEEYLSLKNDYNEFKNYLIKNL